MFKVIVTFSFCLLLLGCATETTNTVKSNSLSKYEIEEQLIQKVRIDKRLKTLGYKFNTKFYDKCKNKRKYIGLSLISKKEIKRQLSGSNENFMSFGGLVKKNIAAYENIVGSLDTLKVVYSLPKSPAAKIGIKKGDQILKVNGALVTTTLNFFNAIEKNKDTNITIKRNGSILDFKIPQTLTCDFNYESFTTLEKKIVFFRSGNTLFVSNTLLDYLKNDDELAMIFANEFAHYINGHPSLKSDIVSLKDSILFSDMWKPFGGFVFSGGKTALGFMEKVKFRYTKEQEGLADFSSIKLTKMLGYNANKAKLFWERLVKEKPSNNMIAKFRDVDSNKIRIINYTLDDPSKEFPSKINYDKFLNNNSL